jgi:iron complex transport system substrate-binding protein
MKSKRIISLIASSTETVFALGFGNRLVGRSHECDYPEEVHSLPVCSSTRVDPLQSSLDIDKQVRSVLENAMSVYLVDVEKLKTLTPDLILTQDHCEVCAVSLKDVEIACHALLDSHPTIVSLAPENLKAVFEGIENIAIGMGEDAAGRDLVNAMQSRLASLRKKTSVFPLVRGAFVEWIQPLMVGANWMPDLALNASCELVLSIQGRHSPQIAMSALVQSDPDFILISPCGFGLERTRIESKCLELNSEWQSLRAVREGKVAIADGNFYFNRPGPRLVESAEILAEVAHGSRINYGHRGVSWEWLD